MGRDKTGYLLLWHRDITFITRLVLLLHFSFFFFFLLTKSVCQKRYCFSCETPLVFPFTLDIFKLQCCGWGVGGFRRTSYCSFESVSEVYPLHPEATGPIGSSTMCKYTHHWQAKTEGKRYANITWLNSKGPAPGNGGLPNSWTPRGEMPRPDSIFTPPQWWEDGERDYHCSQEMRVRWHFVGSGWQEGRRHPGALWQWG